MTMLDFYSKKIDLTIAVVHEYQEDKNRKLGSPYYHLKTKWHKNEKIESNLKNTEYAAALNGHFKGFDTGLYFARYFHENPYYNVLEHEKKGRSQYISMYGGSFNFALDNLLIKTEAA